MIINDEWRQGLAERIAEEMTLYLLDVTNPNSENDLCGCLTCLSKVAIDVVIESLREESEIHAMRETHEKNMKNNNVN